MCRNHGGKTEEEHHREGTQCLQTGNRQAVVIAFGFQDILSSGPPYKWFPLSQLLFLPSLQKYSAFSSNLTQPQHINYHLYTGTLRGISLPLHMYIYLYISTSVKRMEMLNRPIEFAMPMNNSGCSLLCPAYSLVFLLLFLGEKAT